MSSESSPTQKKSRGNGENGKSESSWPRWAIWVLIGLALLAISVPSVLSQPQGEELTYTEFLTAVREGRVDKVEFDNGTYEIAGEYKESELDADATEADGKFRSTGFREFSESDRALLADNGVTLAPNTPTTSVLGSIVPLLLPVGLLIGFFIWMQRRASGQMGNIMSIGRSKAKTYSSERPATKFEDVAGYEGVKTEITEVIDFLKMPGRFAEIGAKVPKGMLLVGPPGTGKTLIARAVAGEAGVPFMSVTGSDFMEMFVGVGASRVRDLFESARKAGRAIIFIDEIDSVGRKRGAGMGGGHDEREQTLNQLLSEMDGFEATEGVVIIAATNRPDVLDPALLRPGRFDRQIVVPLPELSEREAILKVHCKSKKMSPDVDLTVIARGSPGMAGADLANLVNEAALYAVRNGDDSIHMRHFEMARDRVLIGATRESVVMSDNEKEVTAYHEGGHALSAAVLPHGDPVHKVTILPAGPALGVTSFLPEERHHYTRHYFEDKLVSIMGGRVAEELMYGVTSAGAASDLMQATSIATRMVREFGMSDKIGPMAWGSNNQVFLGDDLMQTRDYSDETAHVIDEEIEQILRDAEDRCRQLLYDNRHSLDLIARSLLEHETIDGKEVYRLVEVGRGVAAQSNGAAATTVDEGLQAVQAAENS